jgi:hypothetical protein
MPDGEAPVLPHARYQKDPEGGWVWGHHPDIMPGQQAELEAVVRRNKASFAYSMAELPGYTGDEEPFRITLNHDRPIFAPPRRHSPLETQVKDTKCGELRGVGFIVPSPPGTQYASNTTMPAKKDAETGEYTD